MMGTHDGLVRFVHCLTPLLCGSCYFQCCCSCSRQIAYKHVKNLTLKQLTCACMTVTTALSCCWCYRPVHALSCRFASLRSLDLSGIPKLGDESLQGLSQLQLTSISFVGCELITGTGLQHVGLVTGLHALDLTGCCKVTPHTQDPLTDTNCVSHEVWFSRSCTLND